ncbi:putative porin [Paraburkholderia sp. BL27I4N3]|uniref:porin n=1 Tax=Paraburkholderia sp. BL27I4N3 TaxID=1938805 RepID=UPI000E27E4B4|nr:porin [Paraburkholderia sp. BL27I4N3]REE07453.1 putative porin [Paraburkholderia sp. BL27I4N3]
MKKFCSLVALTIPLAGNANAQSSVTLYGVLDNGITYINNQGGHSAVIEDSGVIQGNRWGLRGKEDLGGGLSAIFVLESGFSLTNGASRQGGALFGRQATVGLTSPFGTVKLGRQNDFMDEFLYWDTAAVQFAAGYSWHYQDADRLSGEQANNSILYTTPNFHGVRAGAMFGFSNMAGSFGGAANSPRVVSYGVEYDNSGPFSVSAAYTSVNGAGGSIGETAFNGTNLRTFGVGGRYLYGGATVFANVTHTTIEAKAGISISVFEGGVSYLVRPDIVVGVADTYTTLSGGVRLQEVSTGAHYLFSKSTDVYVTGNYEHSNSLKIPPQMFGLAPSSTQDQLAFRVGLRHRF